MYNANEAQQRKTPVHEGIGMGLSAKSKHMRLDQLKTYSITGGSLLVLVRQKREKERLRERRQRESEERWRKFGRGEGDDLCEGLNCRR